MPLQEETPSFQIGAVPIRGQLILAPMVGYCDLPFRLICRQFGSAMSYVPLVLDAAVVHGSRNRSPCDFDERERPVALQLVSKEVELLIAACRKLMPLEPDIIDLNLGCPTRRVAGAGRGAGLLREPRLVADLVANLVASFDIPVTAKIRLGWDAESLNYLQIARMLEDNGISAIAVHGRTREQGFSGKANWDAIAQIKRAVSVPVFANGDVRSVADIQAIQSATNCDAVLIGRGAIGNPWIFAGRDIGEVPYEERLDVVHRHLSHMVAYHGERLGLVRFRKHVVHYIRSLASAAKLRPRLVAAETPQELLQILDSWHPREGSGHRRSD